MQCRLVGGIFFYLPKYLFRKVYKHIISRVFILLKVCGREDGSIILVPATQTIMLHMLSGRHQKFPNWPQHQILLGMNLSTYVVMGRVKQNFRVVCNQSCSF